MRAKCRESADAAFFVLPGMLTAPMDGCMVATRASSAWRERALCAVRQLYILAVFSGCRPGTAREGASSRGLSYSFSTETRNGVAMNRRGSGMHMLQKAQAEGREDG